MADDFSGWTFTEVTPPGQSAAQQPAQQAAGQQADITQHDPQTYASLTTNAAIKNLHDMNLMPDIGTARDIYTKAMEESQQHWQRESEAAQAKRLELQTRAAAVTQGTDVSGKPTPSLLQVEEQQRANIAQQKEQQLEQWKQTGETHALSDQDLNRVQGYVNGYDTADKLQKYHYDMAATTPGAGGFLRSHILGFLTQPDIDSQQTKNFNSFLESSIVPLGRGVFGDAATAATKESIQANMRSMLANKDDNPLSAGYKTFMLKDRIMQNLVNDRAIAAAGHKDTAPYDTAIGRLSSDYMSPEVRQFASGNTQIPLIANGQSPEAKASIANLNAKASAGIPNVVQNAGAAQSPNVVPGATPEAAATALSANPQMVAPPSYGAPQPYRVISNDPGMPQAPGAIKGLVDAPAEILKLLTPKPGGPTQDLTQPQISSLGTYTGY